MPLFRTVDPAVDPVSIVEAKAHLRIDHDSEDVLIGGLIRAATAEVERQTGLALIEQDWRLVLDAWPVSPAIELKKHPIIDVLSVTTYGADGEAVLLPTGQIDLDRWQRPARLAIEKRPAPGAAINGIEIDFRAGFGPAATDVPDLLKRAILILVAHWYEFRGAFDADAQPVSIPSVFDRLIVGYRARCL